MSDLKDCLRHIDYKAENSHDESARQEMLELFREINEDWGGNVVEYALYL
tara:strand:+ start:428 stop:577 length:150 start_codon:yes stop_codon:yes gene_type:complete